MGDWGETGYYTFDEMVTILGEQAEDLELSEDVLDSLEIQCGCLICFDTYVAELKGMAKGL